MGHADCQTTSPQPVSWLMVPGRDRGVALRVLILPVRQNKYLPLLVTNQDACAQADRESVARPAAHQGRGCTLSHTKRAIALGVRLLTPSPANRARGHCPRSLPRTIDWSYALNLRYAQDERLTRLRMMG